MPCATNLDGLSKYPATLGTLALRESIAVWLNRRYKIPAPDPASQILPTLGSREALFSLAQTVLDPSEHGIVVCPNPFYQIYEGATYLAGAEPYFVNAVAEKNFGCDYDSVPETVWQKTKLVYVCSPGKSDRGGHGSGTMEKAVRTLRPLRIRHRIG